MKKNCKLYIKILNYPLKTFFLFITLALFSAFQLPQLKVLVSMNDLVDKTLLSAKNYRTFQDEFKLKNSVILIFEPKNGQWTKEHWDEYRAWKRKWTLKTSYADSLFSAENLIHPQVLPGEIYYDKTIPENAQDFKDLLATPWKRILSDETQKFLAVQVNLKSPPPPEKYGSFWPLAVKELFLSLEEMNFKHFTVNKVGNSSYTYFAVKGVHFNLYLNLLFLLILFLGLKFLTGTWRSGTLIILTFIWSGICIHGLMSFVGHSMEVLSSALLTMIIISCLEDFLFICYEMKRGYELEEALIKLFWPSLFTSLTTALGFGSLMFTDIEILQRFGLWSSVGALLEWSALFLFLPSVVKIFKLKSFVIKNQNNLIWERWSEKLNILKPSRKLSYLLLLTYPLSYLALSQLQPSDSLLGLFPKNHEITKSFTSFKKDFGWEGEASLVFPLEVDENTQRKFIHQIQTLPNINKIESYFEVQDYLLSFDQEGYESAILTDFQLHPLHKRYRGHLLSFRHPVFLKTSSLSSVKSTMMEVEKICQNKCHLIGEIISYVEFMDKIPRALLESLSYSLLMVGIILWALATYHRLPHPFLFTLGSLWGASTLVLLMYVFDLKLNFLSCVFICMMVGLTGDNGIQFIFAEKREKGASGISYFQGCALQVGLIMAGSSLFFLGSYFAPPREFALILFLGFLISMFGDIWLTKSLTENSGRRDF